MVGLGLFMRLENRLSMKLIFVAKVKSKIWLHILTSIAQNFLVKKL
jgi:hypothetical protein